MFPTMTYFLKELPDAYPLTDPAPAPSVVEGDCQETEIQKKNQLLFQRISPGGTYPPGKK